MPAPREGSRADDLAKLVVRELAQQRIDVQGEVKDAIRGNVRGLWDRGSRNDHGNKSNHPESGIGGPR